MFFSRDSETADDLVRFAPPKTYGQSQVLDQLIDLFRASPADTDEHPAALEIIPYFLKKYARLEQETLPALALKTPVDQFIICAFAEAMYAKYISSHDDDNPASAFNQFRFTAQQIHCLDYLDYVRRVLHVIEDCIVVYQERAWAGFEKSYDIEYEKGADEWYDTVHLPRIEQGWNINCCMDASTVVAERLEKMHLAVGEQYSVEVLQIIKARPQHIVGGYFVAQEHALA